MRVAPITKKLLYLAPRLTEFGRNVANCPPLLDNLTIGQI